MTHGRGRRKPLLCAVTYVENLHVLLEFIAAGYAGVQEPRFPLLY